MSRIACRGDGRALFVQRGRSDIHEQPGKDVNFAMVCFHT